MRDAFASYCAALELASEEETEALASHVGVLHQVAENLVGNRFDNYFYLHHDEFSVEKQRKK